MSQILDMGRWIYADDKGLLRIQSFLPALVVLKIENNLTPYFLGRVDHVPLFPFLGLSVYDSWFTINDLFLVVKKMTPPKLQINTHLEWKVMFFGIGCLAYSLIWD